MIKIAGTEDEWLEIFKDCYNNYIFKKPEIKAGLDPECRYSSQWVFGDLVGRDKVFEHLWRKSITIKNAHIPVKAEIVPINLFGHKKAILYTAGEQKVIVLLTVNEEGHISGIDICIPGLFGY